MKLTSIRLTNFLSHGSTSWELNGARLATVIGANGAGKSSLLEAILFCFYDAARARTDALVRLGEIDMSASVTFEFAGSTYRVTRGRTTKAGGRSTLELAIADGDAWRPLTGDDIRSTQEAIVELLRMDADTFTSAAFLRQGELDRFVSATPADRKRVLGEILSLDVYAAAEALARDLARTVAARRDAAASSLERMAAELLERPEQEDIREKARSSLATADAGLEEQAAERSAVGARLIEIEGSLAAADAAAAEHGRLEGDRAAVAEQWRSTSARIATRRETIERARGQLVDATEVAAAVGALLGQRAALEEIERAQDEHARLETELREIREARATAEAAEGAAAAAWKASYEAARSRVDELAAAAAALVPITCPKCGTAVSPDGGDLARRLSEARTTFRELEGSEPTASATSAREAGKLARLESRQRELGYDPRRLIDEQAELNRLTALAARAELHAAATDAIVREQAGIAEDEAALEQITARGVELASRLEALKTTIAAGDAARAARIEARARLEALDALGRELGRTKLLAERIIAAADAALERLEKVAVEAAALEAQIGELELEAGRLRRLVGAFGVGGIPARIVESVLPELGRYANELLAELRPGMTIELRAQRAKRDGSGVVEALDLVVRDDVGERPLALYSGGERMSVSLALAVGLSRLVARRAGSRIASLVIDEPDGLDAEARRAFGASLRILAHQGDLDRVVLVSHHEDLAEVGDAVYRVSKGAAGSVVEQVV